MWALNQYAAVVADQKLEVDAIDVAKLCSRREEALFDLRSPLAQIVIGVRRSGKSTLCHKVLKEKKIHYAYLNFDDERLQGLKTRDLNSVLEALYMVYGEFRYLFLDEIQNVDGWFLFVNRLLRQKIHVVLTGSNAKLLSGELSTHLTGRYNQVELFPFSFSEFLQYANIRAADLSTKGIAFKKAAFENYLTNGGFPELFEVKDASAYIQNLLDGIIERDIRQRFRVRYPEALHKIAGYLIDNFAQEISYAALAKKFNLGSSHTVENYVGYLRQAYLLLGVHKFSFKSKERISHEKTYVVDTAFISQRANTVQGKNTGWRLENLVYVELLRRKRAYLYDVYYYREDYEIDFVVCQRNRVIELIQVSENISAAKTFKRETGALFRAAQKFGCKKLTLITLNETGVVKENRSRIDVVPVIDWLCEGEYPRTAVEPVK
jgi:predicted AAA+ superfamily ATPase